MKADPQGRPVEQLRARMGWKSRMQVEDEGGDVSRRCGRCRFVFIARVLGRGGRPEHPYHCGILKAGGGQAFQTRKTATCNLWKQRP